MTDCTHLDRVVAGGDSAVGLNLDVGGRMGELAVGVRSRAPSALILAANLELQPKRVLAAQHHASLIYVGPINYSAVAR